MTVQLPAGSRIEAKAASAELRGVGRLGDVAFEGAYRRSRSTRPRASASPRSTATSRSAGSAAPRRSAPARATSGSPRPSAARSCSAPSPATSRSAPPPASRPPWTPAPPTAASATPSRTRHRRARHPRHHLPRRHHRPQPDRTPVRPPRHLDAAGGPLYAATSTSRVQPAGPGRKPTRSKELAVLRQGVDDERPQAVRGEHAAVPVYELPGVKSRNRGVT